VRNDINTGRDDAHHYRRLLRGDVRQQTSGMLVELAREAEAVAEDIETAANSALKLPNIKHHRWV
jgi:hypothetical protein